jgi:hypothetical protein
MAIQIRPLRKRVTWSKNHGVVAIIGPVDSDCTKRVIQEGLNVPIISALSTNPGLTDDRDRWFFRATLNDRDRMVRYAQFVTATLKIAIGPHVRGYGMGLCAALSGRVGGSANVKELTWDKIVGAAGDAATPERLRSGNAFSPQLGEMIAGASSMFILGPSKQAVAIAQGIKEAYHPPARVPFFFVGSDTDLLLDAPEGSYTIGEPVSDLDESPLTQAARKELAKIQEDFASRSPYAENFVLTAYEAAYYVLPAAIASAVGSQGRVPELAALRVAHFTSGSSTPSTWSAAGCHGS